eukprot:c20658_g1_i2 orf=2-2245(-)
MQEKKPVQWSRLCNMLKNFAKKKDLSAGRRLHLFLIRNRLDTEGFLGDHLIRFYTMCGSLQDASQVFFKIQVRSVYSWNSIISAHLKLGSSAVALHLYVRMLHEGVVPDKVTFLCIVKACTTLAALDEGRLAHALIFQHDLSVDAVLGSAIVAFYASFGCLRDAQRVFDDVSTQDVVLWGTIISAYTQYSDTAALELFDTMLTRGLTPSHFILNCILKVCASARDIRLLHEHIIKNGFESDFIIGSSLVHAYSKVGDLHVAYSVFRKLGKRDIILWGALIDGYARHGDGITALELFCEMQQDNIKPDLAIFLSILEACVTIGDIKQSRVLHDRIIKSGFDVDVTIGSSLVNTYAVWGSLHEGLKVFDTILDRDVVSWGALISGYVRHGYYQSVIESVTEMQEENIEPDGVILLSLLRGCGGLRAIRQGWHIHDHMVRQDFLCNVDAGNVLVSMYVECGSLDEARRVFDTLPTRNEVTWGAMITGYVQEGDCFAAFELLDAMPIDHLKPDGVIFLSALKACSIAGAARKGMVVHDQVIQSGLDSEAIVLNMLVHMYACCECSDEVHKVFVNMPKKDVVSWSALITGLASNGKSTQAKELLEDMQSQGLKPDDTTFTIVLSAYIHCGLVEEGLQLYQCMRHMQPTLAHFNCFMDLFSRTGRLNEAKELSQAMPFLPDTIGRTALLTSSKTFGSMELGRHCFDQAVSLDLLHNNALGMVRMSSAYEEADMKDTNQVQETMEFSIQRHEFLQ